MVLNAKFDRGGVVARDSSLGLFARLSKTNHAFVVFGTNAAIPLDHAYSRFAILGSENDDAMNGFARGRKEEVKMETIGLTYVESETETRYRDLRTQVGSFCDWLRSASAKSIATYFSVVTYLTIVASVAVYDILLTIHYWRSLKEMEENPIGRWLMNLDRIPDGVMPNLTLFITVKSLGTLVVLAAIAMLVLRYARIGHPVALGVSCFQLGLATYLTYGENG